MSKWDLLGKFSLLFCPRREDRKETRSKLTSKVGRRREVTTRLLERGGPAMLRRA